MKFVGSLFGVALGLAFLALVARFLGVEDFIRESLARGYLPDWVMGSLSLIWFLVILKAPWDLFFQANTVAFEQQRSRERGMPLQTGREEYVLRLRNRLLVFAIGAHLFSAALVAGLSWFTHGSVGYYFAVFYVVSTTFRPAAAGYAYLQEKLRAVGEESRYPREDVEELRQRVLSAENRLSDLETMLQTAQQEQRQRDMEQERQRAEIEYQITEQRQRLHDLSREFEVTVSRLTDNQEVIRGIQAFVRLIRTSGAAAS